MWEEVGEHLDALTDGVFGAAEAELEAGIDESAADQASEITTGASANEQVERGVKRGREEEDVLDDSGIVDLPPLFRIDGSGAAEHPPRLFRCTSFEPIGRVEGVEVN